MSQLRIYYANMEYMRTPTSKPRTIPLACYSSPPPPLTSCQPTLCTIWEEDEESSTESTTSTKTAGGGGDQSAAFGSFEFGGGRSKIPTSNHSQGDDSTNSRNQAILQFLHTSLLEGSSMEDELEEVKRQIKKEQKLLRRARASTSASANNSKTSLICNTSTSTSGGAGAVAADQSNSVADYVSIDIENSYEWRELSIDKNKNAVRICPVDEENQLKLDLTTTGGREANTDGRQVAEDESLPQSLVRWVERSVNREDVLEKVGTSSRYMMFPPISPTKAVPLSSSSPYVQAYANPQSPPSLTSSRPSVCVIYWEDEEELSTSATTTAEGGGDQSAAAADSFEVGGGRSRISTSMDSRGDDWTHQSIFHGTILEESSMVDELEERALQIAALKLKLIGALKSQRKLQLLAATSASANNSKTSLICNASTSGGAGAVAADQSNSVASFVTFGNATVVGPRASSGLFSVVSEIEDFYDRSRGGVDENRNAVRIWPLDEEYDLELDLTTTGGREADTDGRQVAEDESLRQHLVRWVERSVNREDVLEKVGTLSVAASQLLAGDLAGWFAAYIVQKFGKVTLTAVGGGLILLKIAHHKGYILVNWSNIYTQLEQVAVNEGQEGVLDDWVTHKVKSFKTWAHNNSYIVIGFMCGFLYKTFG